MRQPAVLGLLLFSLCLVGGPRLADAADADHFRALNLVRLSKTIPLPDLTLTDLSGQQVSLKSLQGKVLLLNFWATW